LIILDPDTGRLYDLFWSSEDNYNKVRNREITMVEAKEECQQDRWATIKIQLLSEAMREHAKDDG